NLPSSVSSLPLHHVLMIPQMVGAIAKLACALRAVAEAGSGGVLAREATRVANVDQALGRARFGLEPLSADCLANALNVVAPEEEEIVEHHRHRHCQSSPAAKDDGECQHRPIEVGNP